MKTADVKRIIRIALREYIGEIGRAGGRKGGRARGARKRRSKAHYARMVKARNLQRKAVKPAKRKRASTSTSEGER